MERKEKRKKGGREERKEERKGKEREGVCFSDKPAGDHARRARESEVSPTPRGTKPVLCLHAAAWLPLPRLNPRIQAYCADKENKI